MYPIEKYRFFKTTAKKGGIKIVAVTTYAGKTVRGVAICHPDDSYDEQRGKEIAAARCAVRVAYKRLKRAVAEWEKAIQITNKAVDHQGKMIHYRNDAESAALEAENYLKSLLDKNGGVDPSMGGDQS